MLNPDGRPVLGGRLRTGDKLMLSGRNLHDLGLMNGTTVRLLEHDEDAEALTISAEGAVLALPRRRRPACGSPTRARSTAGRASSCRWRC